MLEQQQEERLERALLTIVVVLPLVLVEAVKETRSTRLSTNVCCVAMAASCKSMGKWSNTSPLMLGDVSRRFIPMQWTFWQEKR